MGELLIKFDKLKITKALHKKAAHGVSGFNYLVKSYSVIISRSSSSSFLRLKIRRIKKNKLNIIIEPITSGLSKNSTKVSGIGMLGVGLTGPPIVIITPSLSSSFGSVPFLLH